MGSNLAAVECRTTFGPEKDVTTKMAKNSTLVEPGNPGSCERRGREAAAPLWMRVGCQRARVWMQFATVKRVKMGRLCVGFLAKECC